MGNDRSPGSQHNVLRYITLLCSKAGNSNLEAVTRTNSTTLDTMPVLVICKYIEHLNKNGEGIF